MTAQSAFKHALMVSFYASRKKEKFFNTTYLSYKTFGKSDKSL